MVLGRRMRWCEISEHDGRAAQPMGERLPLSRVEAPPFRQSEARYQPHYDSHPAKCHEKPDAIEQPVSNKIIDELSKKEVDLYIVEGFMVSAAYTDKVKYSQIAVDDSPV
ncbi:hypothetical protein Pcinc_005924 [Petrolisthes cinctipes]|uniref:Uncharacterized protein n=1 Tax=Petrolisthes cinctipes TaxID=88211 RepID=A0AAE1GIC1_PETCI|nr:hypothetical protein Pcinc_005924 [Petrolisthes cinctipes]